MQQRHLKNNQGSAKIWLLLLTLSLAGCDHSRMRDPYVYYPPGFPITPSQQIFTDSTLFGSPELAAMGAQVIIIGQYVRIVIPSDLLFELNSQVLQFRSIHLLAAVAAYIQRCHGFNVVVTGYLDNPQEQAISLNITRRQAQSVLAYLWSHGIPIEKLQAFGYGKYRNIAANDRSVGSYFNRRIEITFSLYNVPLKK